MYPPSRFLVPALFALNRATIDVYASLGPPAEALARRGDTHRTMKREIRNAYYATNAPPKPLDPFIATTHTTIASAGTAKVQKRLIPVDDSSANLFDPSELSHRFPPRSGPAFWRRTVDVRTRLLEERAASMSAAKQGPRYVNPDLKLFSRTPNYANDFSKNNRPDSMLARDINEDIRAAWKKRATYYPDPHHIPRHIVKHDYHSRVSVVKHTLPARRNTAGTSPESIQDVADAKRSVIHSRRRE